jgi:hypothetical protein
VYVTLALVSETNIATRAYPKAPEIKIKLEVAENCVIIYTPHYIRIIRIIKSRTMKYVVHILRMGQKKHVNYKRFSLKSIKEKGGLEEFGMVGRAI